MAFIFPSLMSANQLFLQKEISATAPLSEGYHIDLMDGHFVPNLCGNTALTNELAILTQKRIWVHLMVTNPYEVIEYLVLPPHSLVSVHLEALDNPTEFISFLHAKQLHASIAINPLTPASETFPYLAFANNVLVMGVEAGFAGQHMLPGTLDKIKILQQHRTHKGLSYSIGCDGGINTNTIASLVRHGVDYCAIGSAIFSHENPQHALSLLARAAQH